MLAVLDRQRRYLHKSLDGIKRSNLQLEQQRKGEAEKSIARNTLSGTLVGPGICKKWRPAAYGADINIDSYHWPKKSSVALFYFTAIVQNAYTVYL